MNTVYVNEYCVEQSLVVAQSLVLVLFASMCAWPSPVPIRAVIRTRHGCITRRNS
jgi:hypothetical protein